ncbi:MAG TPA: hypothetical protein VF540_10575 [Segetibacter sp.]|jgi:hypothetical protein
MELDDLKESWKKAGRTENLRDGGIIELIQNKSVGPLADLRKSFRKQIFLVVFLVTIIIINLGRKHQIFNDVIFWCYIGCCIGLCVFFYVNYRLVSKMACMDCVIRSNLEKQVETLEKRLKWKLVAVRIALVFFIVLFEVLPYFAHEPMLDKWHKVPLLIRLLAYAAFLTLQYFLSRSFSRRRYGSHLSHLKQLLDEMKAV